MHIIASKTDRLIKQHLKILKELQYPSGLFAASRKKVRTGYDKAWIRDNFYECIAFEMINDWETVKKTYDALLKVFIKHEYKIDYAIREKPQHKHQYIHARFHPQTFDEFWEEWGNKQNDSIGAILFKIGELEAKKQGIILGDENHRRIVQKLVLYLKSIEYWHDFDSGMWEEDEEVHASSVGACLAGLKKLKENTTIMVEDELIAKGEEGLNKLLPRESKKKFADMALLSLIYPYGIVKGNTANEILRNVEYHLVKHKGVIRYKNDHYYNKNPDGYSEEAEWTFGFSWLSIIYGKMGNKEKERYYIRKTLSTLTTQGIPELYYSNSDRPNDNNPLGWSESLFIVALYEMNKKHLKLN